MLSRSVLDEKNRSNNRFDLTTRPVTQSAKYVGQIARQSRVAGQAYVMLVNIWFK